MCLYSTKEFCCEKITASYGFSFSFMLLVCRIATHHLGLPQFIETENVAGKRILGLVFQGKVFEVWRNPELEILLFFIKSNPKQDPFQIKSTGRKRSRMVWCIGQESINLLIVA